MPDAAPAVVQTESPYRASDGCVLHTFRWSSRATDASPNAVVVIMHGYGEHCGRYREVAEALVRAGYLACGFDARGHGRSPGQRGHIASYDRYVDDIHGYATELRKRHPGLPLIILGHSNGGLITLRMVQTRSPVADGLILTAPLVALQSGHQPMPRWMAQVLAAAVKRLPVPSGIKSEELTHDLQIVAAHKRDKLNHNWSTPGWYVAATGAMLEVFANPQSVTLPMLVFEADSDPIVVGEAVTRVFNAVGSKDKELVVCKNSLHELLNEIGREDTFRRITSWLSARWTPRAAAE